MNEYAVMLRKNLREVKPDLYRELKKAGELDRYCQEQGERAARQHQDLISAGMRDYEAREVVVHELFQ